MRTFIKIAVIALTLVLLLGIKGAKAHEDFTKVIRKEFSVNADALLSINNRFGKIQCTNWDKNAINIEVTITVSATDKERADKLFDRISVDFTDSQSAVTAITNIKESKGHSSRFSIDYSVKMPASLNIDLTNKFGDIFINEVAGKSKINLGYGNLDARKLANDDNTLDIKFGKAHINWINAAVAALKYSDLSLEYAGTLRLESKFSNLDADKILVLNVSFEGGKLNMEKSSAVESHSKFSDLDIGRIEQSLNLDIQYGNCNVDEMPASFTSVNVKNKYANISIGLPDDARYNLDAALKYCELDFPEEMAKFSFRSSTPTEKVLRGMVGKADSGSPKVTIRSEYGNIELKK